MFANTYCSKIHTILAPPMLLTNIRQAADLHMKFTAIIHNTSQYNFIKESIMVLFKSWIQLYMYIEYRNCILLGISNKDYFNVRSIMLLR